jgi:hypothetical protein
MALYLAASVAIVVVCSLWRAVVIVCCWGVALAATSPRNRRAERRAERRAARGRC